MKDISLIVIGSKDRDNTVNNESGSFLQPLSSIVKQLTSHDISYTVYNNSLELIPHTVDSNLVMFIDHSFLVKNDYVFNAVTLNNLHRDSGIIFGPTAVHSKSNKFTKYIKNSYYGYDLDFGSTYTADITDEPHNYGSLYNAVISGAAYNRVGFSGCKTPRSFILDNMAFFKEVSKTSKIYYSSIIKKTKVLSEEDFQHKNVSDYYYDLGYLDGVSSSTLSGIQKRDDLWKRFVEAPEVIDCNHPRWLFEESKDENCDYLELLVLLKCKYQIGYFEGMLGKRVI